MLISFPPGGPIDLQTRILAKYLEKEVGVQVIPINKPGGGGSLGAGILASSRPDGYTLSLMAQSSIIMPVLLKEADFSIEDFRAIGQAVAPPPVVFCCAPGFAMENFPRIC
jgi:tripartite-type tricarboxylate transporter receptor subunit TctC